MASLDWNKIGAKQKYKSMPAIIRHNSKDSRERTAIHSNPHINASMTQYNYNIDGLTCAERCERYKARLAELDSKPKANKRKDRVTAIALETSVPEKLTAEQHIAWCQRVYDILSEQFGAENMIYGDVHADEVHEYADTRTKTWKKSRVHLHVGIVPVDDKGVLNAKKVETRANMNTLNNAIEDMSRREFGVKWQTGEKRKGADVDVLKRESETVVHRQQVANTKHKKALDTRESDLKTREQALQIEREKLQADYASRLQHITERERAIQEREKNMSLEIMQKAYELTNPKMHDGKSSPVIAGVRDSLKKAVELGKAITEATKLTESQQDKFNLIHKKAVMSQQERLDMIFNLFEESVFRENDNFDNDIYKK